MLGRVPVLPSHGTSVPILPPTTLGTCLYASWRNADLCLLCALHLPCHSFCHLVLGSVHLGRYMVFCYIPHAGNPSSLPPCL
jgi:hypothetical protein